MAPGFSDPVFYTIFVAPGFITVMTAISLASVEDEIPSFVILIWSLVSSLVIDTVFLAFYQWWYGGITSFDAMTGIFFLPYFRTDLIFAILLGSFSLGLIYTGAILGNLPGHIRMLIQRKARITYNPRQPWENFMSLAGSVLVKTNDDQLYSGRVVQWSRATKPKELWIDDLSRYDKERDELEPFGGETAESGPGSDAVFLEDNIDRVVIWEKSTRKSYWRQWWGNRFWSSRDERDGDDGS